MGRKVVKSRKLQELVSMSKFSSIFQEIN